MILEVLHVVEGLPERHALASRAQLLTVHLQIIVDLISECFTCSI